jgi:hypothetical protein
MSDKTKGRAARPPSPEEPSNGAHAPDDRLAPVHVHLPESALLPPELRGGEVVLEIPLSARDWVTGARPTAADLPAIKKADVAILLALSVAGCQTKTQEELALPGPTGLCHRTVGTRLRKLRELGLVREPLGKNNGWAITDAGRNALGAALMAGIQPA